MQIIFAYSILFYKLEKVTNEGEVFYLLSGSPTTTPECLLEIELLTEIELRLRKYIFLKALNKINVTQKLPELAV